MAKQAPGLICGQRTPPGSAYPGLRCNRGLGHTSRHRAEVSGPGSTLVYWVGDSALSYSQQAGGEPTPGTRAQQVGGDHYAKHKIQPWDVWQEYGLNAFEGAVVKYLLRRKGDRVEDLKKARHTLDRLIEIEEGRDGGE